MLPRFATRVAVPSLLLVAVIACQDEVGTTAPDGDPIPQPSLQTMRCEANVPARSLTCVAPSLTPSEGLSFLVVGGQRDYVTLASRNVSYASGVFSADVRVQNRMSQPLGTPDGTTITGIRPFFHTLPAVTGGTGTVSVRNAAGTGTFTAANQPYFEYSEILTRYAVSGEQTWEWNVEPTVTTFAFEMLVDADIPHETGVLRWRGRTDQTLRAMWGAGGELFAVGVSGAIVRHDGDNWSVQRTGSEELRAVGGTSVTDVFAVGLGGVILHHDGVTWTSQSSGTSQDLLGVWANAPDDVFAVGTSGTILHYDGSGWSAQTSGTTANLSAVWGASGGDVFAVGAGGTIRHFDGSSWGGQSSPVSDSLTAVWGSSGSDVFAVGAGGKIVHYGGASWTPEISNTTYDLYSVWGTSSSDVFAAGAAGTILYFNGVWTPQANPYLFGFAAVWGVPSGYVYALSSHSFVVLEFDGYDWYYQTPPELGDVGGLWASSLSAVVMVAYNGEIAAFDGDDWFYVSGGVDHLSDVWGAAADDVFAVGFVTAGDGAVTHFDGTSWTPTVLSGTPHLNDVWGTSGSDVFAVGLDGAILHFDGSSWTPQSSFVPWQIKGVWGSSATDVFAVGDGGVLHYNGASWSTQTLPPTTASTGLTAVWGSASNDVYAVGISGEIYHYGGSSWSLVSSGTLTTEALTDVWGTSAADVFVVGENSVILHYNGAEWTPQLTGLEGTGADFRGIWGLATDLVGVVGSGGMLLQAGR